MTLAKKCGLRVPAIDLTTVLDRQDVFLIKRFDRERHQQNVFRIGFLSGLTATGLTNLTDSVFGGIGYRNLVSWLRRNGDSYTEDARELFMRMVFNIICNNNDDHLRNHGFLRKGQQWHLSPLYDVVPSRETGFEGRRLLLTVGTQGRDATLENALSESNLFGVDPQEAKTIIAKMVRIAKYWRDLYKKCGVSEKDIDYISSAFAAVEH